jgi:hypothetical protein
VGSHIAKDVLGLDISMADSLSVDVGNRTHELIGVEFDNEVWHFLLHFEVLLHYTVGGIGNVVHHHIQVDFFWFIAIGVETLAHFDAVGVVQHFQNGQLPVLIPFILENFLDSHCLTCFSNDCLEHHSKGPIPYNFFSIVSEALLGNIISTYWFLFFLVRIFSVVAFLLN